MDKAEVLHRLTAGNRRFTADKLNAKFNDSHRRNELLEGQDPFAIILSCADSRVVPELIFDTGPGDLFVVRVAGNVANTSSIASIEYAVAHLGTSVLIVLGHEQCGAVTAAVKGGKNGENIDHLLAHIRPAIQSLSECVAIDDVTKKHVELTAEVLLERSSIIAKAVKEEGLKIVTAYYHLESGEVEFLG